MGFRFGGRGGGGGLGDGGEGETITGMGDARAVVDADVKAWNGPKSGEDGVVIVGDVATRLDGPTDSGFSGTGESTCTGPGGEGEDTGTGTGSGSSWAPGKWNSSSSESSLT